MYMYIALYIRRVRDGSGHSKKRQWKIFQYLRSLTLTHSLYIYCIYNLPNLLFIRLILYSLEIDRNHSTMFIGRFDCNIRFSINFKFTLLRRLKSYFIVYYHQFYYHFSKVKYNKFIHLFDLIIFILLSFYIFIELSLKREKGKKQKINK